MAAGDGLDPSTPLVLTLEMDGASFAQLNQLRRDYFPPERNLVPAHITMFHQLPGDRLREINAFLSRIASGQRSIEIVDTEVKVLERGVALFVRSPQLSALRDALAAEWWPWLIEQDRGGFRPHVTIQNKVSPAEAKRTSQAVSALLGRIRIAGVGLHLWRYSGGPWIDVRLFSFRRGR